VPNGFTKKLAVCVPAHVQVVVPPELRREGCPSLVRQGELDPAVEAELQVLADVLEDHKHCRVGAGMGGCEEICVVAGDKNEGRTQRASRFARPA